MEKMEDMEKSFILHDHGNKYTIERVTYPRFKGVVSFKDITKEDWIDIDEVELLDEIKYPSDIDNVIKDAIFYVNKKLLGTLHK